MTFGARMLKTGMAVTLALYLSTLLHTTAPVIAAVAAIFALQPSIYRSWRYFLDQLQTNTLGAALALVAGTFFSKHPIAIGIVCILAIMICLKMKMEANIGLTLVTVIAVMDASGGHWWFAVNRFLLTSLGVGSAFIINIVFFPPNWQKKFMEEVHGVFNKISPLQRTVISNEMKESVFQETKDELIGSLFRLEEKYKLFEEEQKKLKRLKYRASRRLVVYKQMLHTLRKGLDILQLVEEHYFQATSKANMNAFVDEHLEALTQYHEYVLMKFEKKFKNESYERLEAMDQKNDKFLLTITDASSSTRDLHRLLVVASGIYDYGHQIVRLDKLVEQYYKGLDEKDKEKDKS
ncbi:aromatic acid exporter family protein [Paenibacillus sp. FJAT-26967]|uniref:FUSC family protein n=1 Tax=Paenibacillus sp. FJAT-26967 TaxID=1729690 RepID=UPI000A4A3D2D|nr:aromatic acid exporter family protein [Paenibacillus sp. FJAT-26967]